MPRGTTPNVSQRNRDSDPACDCLAGRDQTARGRARALRFGSIDLAIHDGKVVQFDITEKRRLT
ncbi:MAG: DUF2292 domain-containing protein [Allosphingosinicella sp.]